MKVLVLVLVLHVLQMLLHFLVLLMWRRLRRRLLAQRCVRITVCQR